MKKKDVILIYPGRKESARVYTPLSVMPLAGVLLENGYNPIIVDTRVDDYRKIKLDNAICVGISTLTGTTIRYGLEVAKYIRMKNPSIPLVWGGVHPTLHPEQTIRNEYVDIIVRGEGEATLIELVKALEENRDLNLIAGLTFKRYGEIINTAEREFIDYDKVPLPPYHLLDERKYNLSSNFYYQSGRGCSHRCTFCDVIKFHRRTIRQRSAETVIRDLETIYNQFHPAKITFIDDNFFPNKKRARQICELIVEKGLHISWEASCRADYFARYEDDFIQLIKKAGCDAIAVGAESGSQRILDIMHKDIKVEDIIITARRAQQFGIHLTYTFIIGVPRETKEDLLKTISLVDQLIEINSDINIAGLLMYTPYPGTPMFEEVLQSGYVPPQSLEAWGEFIINDKSQMCWHPKSYVDFLERIAQMTRWRFESFPSIKNFAWAIIKFKPYSLLYHLLNIPFHIRWKYKFFNLPLDIRFGAFLRKRLFGYG